LFFRPLEFFLEFILMLFILKQRDTVFSKEKSTSKAMVTDKKISVWGRRSDHTDYELYFSYMTPEKIISKTMDVVSEEGFQAVNVGDSVTIIYLPKKSDMVDLIIDRDDRRIYARNLRRINE